MGEYSIPHTILNTEQTLGIHPNFFNLKSGGLCHAAEPLQRILLRMLGMDRFPFREMKRLATDLGSLVPDTVQVHLNPPGFHIVNRTMAKPVQVKGATIFTV